MESGKLVRQIALVNVTAKVTNLSGINGQPTVNLDLGEAQAAINYALAQVSANADVDSIKTSVMIMPTGMLAIIEFSTLVYPEPMPGEPTLDEPADGSGEVVNLESYLLERSGPGEGQAG